MRELSLYTVIIMVSENHSLSRRYLAKATVQEYPTPTIFVYASLESKTISEI